MNRLPALHALALIGGLGLLLLILVGYCGLSRGPARSLGDFGEAPSFTLVDHLGRPVNSDELRGRVVVANFIYTNCTDICPLLSFQMQQLQDRLRQEGLLGEGVQLLSFTTDPDRDTPAALRAYAERHRADPETWRFLTGPKEQIEPLVVQGFKLGLVALPPRASEGKPAGGHDRHQSYEVMHSGRFVLIDRRWQIREYYDGREFDLDPVIRDVRQLLR